MADDKTLHSPKDPRKLEKEQEELQRKQSRSFGFFGFEIRRKPAPEEEKQRIVSFVPPVEETEGAYVTTAAGYYGQVLDVRGDYAANDRDLIVKYRNAAMQAECDSAIEDIVNESIVADDEHVPVTLNLDKIDKDLLDDQTRETMIEEFEYICSLLDFGKYGHDIFRRWYIDGRIVFHKVIDLNDPKSGIQEVRPINPLKIQKIKEVKENQDPKTGIKIIEKVDEFFVYSDEGFGTGSPSSTYSSTIGMPNLNGVKIPVDTITFVTSGIMDAARRSPLSHLHKALRAVNQLRYMEDSLVIYRLSRAPERRIFYIDVGNMPAKKAEEYVRSIRDAYRNKIVYDAKTGEIRQDAKQMSILEDFWIPRRDGGKSTEITTLPGGENLGQLDDVVYFQKKLYKAMNVPIGRLDEESGFSLGRAAEISRDELKFQKFIDRLRKRFSEIFKDLLKTQCILKDILSSDEWDDIKENVIIDYTKDSYFSELKEAEIWRERIDTLNQMTDHVGRFFSEEWIMKNVLQQTDEDIKQMRKEIYDEAIRRRTSMPIPKSDDAQGGQGGPSGNAVMPGNPPLLGGPQGEGGEPQNPENPAAPQTGQENPQGVENQQGTGLGGVNDIPAPPPEADEEDADETSNEPSLNTNVEFPDIEDVDPDGENVGKENEEDEEKKQKTPRR